MLRQRLLGPLLRITPLPLELGDDILVRVRVEFGVREKHTKDGAPSAVESTSNPAGRVTEYGQDMATTQEEDLPMEGAGRIASKVETLVLRSGLGDVGICMLELTGAELTKRS